ncbi:hypothetical protein LEP1GSC202_3775 [Leptospira yanagawae serovar Saopaulo str. Sao Paulo = ATCC 700523]|uniref:Uncharacterized protein n=1 Tax=Leptospira yanagawae serovar Saopaulo str. Sao Paulo = ATCC 700523 TaxID=1249483 RepID=A0A5E8HHB3_9LEPT|nr:hypothetical protein LEP1GSC202_3775 [Leptospira yanagawae serovar Saopaulo str. Sao Paulo = ATCC 700523]
MMKQNGSILPFCYFEKRVNMFLNSETDHSPQTTTHSW